MKPFSVVAVSLNSQYLKSSQNSRFVPIFVPKRDHQISQALCVNFSTFLH